MSPLGCFVKVFRKAVNHRKGLPPGPNSPEVRHRDALLELCLDSHSLRDIKRKCELKMLLRSDLSDHKAYYYSPEDNPDLDRWANRLATAILPARVTVMQRRRWMNQTSLSPIREAALASNIFKGLQKAIKFKSMEASFRHTFGLFPNWFSESLRLHLSIESGRLENWQANKELFCIQISNNHLQTF